MRTAPAVLAAALMVAALGLTGCASGGGKTDAAPSSSGASASAPDDLIAVVVANGKVSPKPSVHKVHLGDRVRLTVTSDRPDQVHLHGYNKEIEIQSGKPGTIDFVADVPGVFEVETHKSNLQLLQLQVQ